MKKLFQKKNIGNILFVILLLVVLLVPNAKAFFLKGLMEIGLFKPSTSVSDRNPKADLNHIQFKNDKGAVLNLGSLKGKVIFVNFWATWCPPCLAEMPSINKFYQRFKDDKEVAFVMVEADGDFLKTNAFMKRKGYEFQAYTFYSELPKNIFDGALPTTVVFDKQGRLSMHEVGAANYNSKKFINFINQLKALNN